MTQSPPQPQLRQKSRPFPEILCDFLATGCYSGRSKYVPGTAGTIVATVLALLMFQLKPELASVLPSTLIAVGLTVLAIAVSSKALEYQLYGSEAKDPRQVVIDEFAGYFFAIVGLGASPLSLALGFVLFRIFDIVKPTPVRQFENLPRGYGIVIDDVAAGIYANLMQRLILFVFS